MTDVITSPIARSTSRDSIILGGLTIGTAVLSGILLYQGLTTWLEAISFVTGAVCVWLTVMENIWNFPIGMLNVATFAIVFFRARLMSDAGLQVVYFVLSGIGWYLWLFGGKGRSPLTVTLASTRRRMNVSIAMLIIWIGLMFVLPHVSGLMVFWDALTTSLCLGAQWLLDRKHLENWLLWIIADVIYVPVYALKGLYLTSMLYAVFLCMAIMGFLKWRKTWLQLREATT
jgi:nicotinamide mononucleotide transporter